MSCVRACRPRTSRHVCVCKCCAPPSRLVRISGLALGHISFMLNKTKVAFGAKGAFPFRRRSRGDVCARGTRETHVQVLGPGYPVGATHGPSSLLRFPSTLIDHLLIFFWSTPASLSSSAWTVRTRGTLVRGSHVSTAPRQEGKKIQGKALWAHFCGCSSALRAWHNGPAAWRPSEPSVPHRCMRRRCCCCCWLLLSWVTCRSCPPLRRPPFHGLHTLRSPSTT